MDALVERLRSKLTDDTRVQAWEIRHDSSRERQIYLIGTQLESEREARVESVSVTVHLRRDGKQGQSRVTFNPGEEPEIDQRLHDAIYMAGLGGDEPYDLAGLSELPRVQLADPSLTGDQLIAGSRELADRWRAAAARLKGARPSSGEIFCGPTTTRLLTSAGFDGRMEATRILVQSIVIASGHGRETERISWEEARRSSDLDLAAILEQAAEEAKDLTRAELPPTGPMAVVILADEMTKLFSPITESSSAEGIYQKSTRLELGQLLPGLVLADGDPLVLSSNATEDFALGSYAFDGDGVAGRRVEVVRDGVFTRPWAGQRYAQYTQSQATGAFANLEIAPGKRSLEELLGDGPVLEVRSFSWLSPDSSRGDFSIEIRLGYLHSGGGGGGSRERRAVKGGSVSGNLYEALGTARFSKETTRRGAYLGPVAVRLETCRVTGS